MATEKRERQRANRQQKNEYQAKAERRQTSTRRVLIGAGIVVGGLILVLAIAALGGAFSDDDSVETADTIATSPTASTSAGSTVAPLPAGEVLPNGFQLGTGECPPQSVDEPVTSFPNAPQLCIDPAAGYTATIATSEGDVVVELAAEDVPGTVNNFVTLARYGYYDDTLIFRADPSIDVVQGGGADNSASPGYNIPDEGDGFTYEEGQIVMARTAEPNSAGGQWFIVTGPNASNLDAQGTYVVFGRVTQGLEIAQAMVENVGADGQTPSEEVRVETILIEEVAGGATDATTATSAPATFDSSTETSTDATGTAAPSTQAANPQTGGPGPTSSLAPSSTGG